jgi:RHS repeat-associated protein
LAPSCRSEDCPRDGGTALCTQVEIKKPERGDNPEGYTYGMCDGSLYTSNDVKWCIAAGGTPGTGPDGGAGCDNLPEHVLGNMGQSVDEESLTYTIPDKKVGNPTCDKTEVIDSGWGKQPEHDPGCWSFNPTSINGINVADRRERTYSGHLKASDGTCSTPWSGTIVVRRDRAVQCPIGYSTRKRADGDTDCVVQPPCCKTLGDPVQVANGARVQREEDYRFGDSRGLQLTRYYYSFGFFRPVIGGMSEIASVDDFWRTSYDIRLYAEPSGSLALATVVSPDGNITSFDTTGTPLQNYGGGADRLRHETDGSWTLVLAAGGRKVFNAAGRLTALVDQNGLQTIVAYDGNGKLGLVEDPYGRQILFSYTGERLSSATTPDGQVIAYGYDVSGRLTSVTYPDGASRSYKYENAAFRFLMTGLVDELGAESIFSYDSYGRATKNSRNGGGFIETYGYGIGTTAYTDALGKTETLTFAVSGGVNRPTASATSCTGCTSAGTTTTFDGNGNRASLRDANGNLTKYTFDLTTNLETSRIEALKSDGTVTTATRSVATAWDASLRKPVTVTHSASGEPDWIESFIYDANGNTLKSTLSSGSQSRSTSYQYDAQGRLVLADGPRTDVQDLTSVTYFSNDDACTGCRGQQASVTDALGHVTTYVAYDANGRLTEEKDLNGITQKNVYDLRGRLTTTTSAFGLPTAETVGYAYDLAGKIATSTAPNGVKATYVYDGLGKLVSVTSPSGSRIVTVRDANGNVIGQDAFDKDGTLRSRSRSVLDPLGQAIGTIDGYGNRTNYVYDSNGNQVSSITPLGSLIQAQYDAADRVISQTAPDGGKTLTSYDSRNHVVAVVDPLGHVTNYTYDGLGNRVSLSSPDTGLTTYEYDSAGNVSGTNDARGVHTTYVYDPLGRLTSSRFGVGSADELLVEYVYDEGSGGIGHLTTSRTPTSVVHFGYDALGRVAVESQTGPSLPARTTSYTYIGGHLASLTYPSGLIVAYQYDADGNILAVTADGTSVVGNATSTPTGALESYTSVGGRVVTRKRDLNGQVVSATLDANGSGQNGAFAYEYDLNGRLTKALGANTYAYLYDPNGNRLSFSQDGVTSAYRYDIASNKLVAVTDSTGAIEAYSYDLRGNTLTRGSDQFDYDARGVLRRSAVMSPLQYEVDGLGRRVVTSDGLSTRSYAYADGYRLLGSYSLPSGESDETIYLGDIPVGIVKKIGDSAPMIYATFTDQLGTTREVADSNGRPVWIWGGEPFGASRPDENPSGLGVFVNHSRFPGQHFDPESGLSYNISRDYDAATGRYAQSDPLGLDAGANTFGYVGSAPLNFVDELGLQASPAPGLSPGTWPSVPSTGTLPNFGTPANDPAMPPGSVGAFCSRLGMAGVVLYSLLPNTTSGCDQPSPPDDNRCPNDACEKAKLDARNAYWELMSKRIPQFQSGGMRGRDANHLKSIYETQQRLRKAISRVRFHCAVLPPEIDEWEMAANTNGPGF